MRLEGTLLHVGGIQWCPFYLGVGEEGRWVKEARGDLGAGTSKEAAALLRVEKTCRCPQDH